MKKVKIKDVCEIFDGVHTTPKYQSTGIPFRSVENLCDDNVDKFVSNEFYESNYDNKNINGESIYITRIGTIGKVKYISDETNEAYYVTLALLRNCRINTLYLSYCLQSPSSQKEILKNSLLDAIPCKINMVDLKNCEILIHKNQITQKKIGCFFNHYIFFQ